MIDDLVHSVGFWVAIGFLAIGSALSLWPTGDGDGPRECQPGEVRAELSCDRSTLCLAEPGG